MGKHERALIEEAEKLIVKILNSQKITVLGKKNPWLEHATAIAARIKRDFPNQKQAHHLGNRYDNTGDILITLVSGKQIFIEFKMSATKEGIGTKANISQDALTENYLFLGRPQSWSEFRKQKGHDKWVSKYLDTFKRYPNSISKITNPILQKEEKARYLRKLKSEGNKKAISILNKIHTEDKQEKLEYLIYLSKQKQQNEMIKRFFVLLILGIHRKDELQSLIKKGYFFSEVKNLTVYYGNSYKGVINVRKEDTGKRIKNLLNAFSRFEISFPPGLTQCKLVGIKDKNSVALLQVVFHWKNIAQGIKTPCLNIFDSGNLAKYL